jgi:hypothetical protein
MGQSHGRDISFRDFLGELEYWGLSALHLEPCCAYTLQRDPPILLCSSPKLCQAAENSSVKNTVHKGSNKKLLHLSTSKTKVQLFLSEKKLNFNKFMFFAHL